MDTRTGQIYGLSDLAEAKKTLTRSQYLELMRNLAPMHAQPTPHQLSRRPPKIGRNERCPCGSGRKFKRCCLGRR